MIVFILPLYCQITIDYIMKKLKVREVIAILQADGWFLYSQNGSHRQFKHHIKKGKATVNGKPSDTLSQELLNSIWKQVGWK